MSTTDLQEIIFSTADRLLMAGVQPTLSGIAESLGKSESEVEGEFKAWWGRVPERLLVSSNSVVIPDVPEVLGQSFARIWEQAVQEASSNFVQLQHKQEVGIDIARREADESLQESRARMLDLEDKLRDQARLNEELKSQLKEAEAEVGVLKTSLAAETSQRKQEEQSRLNVEQDLNHLRKTYDDAKRTFDKRIKDKERHALETVSKSDADVRYYRGALGKLRDEVGKKESALTKTIHELQAELARKDAKSDMQKSQIKSLEDELEKIKSDTSGQSRDMAKINAKLLSESNKNKRLEDKIKELDEEVRKARQKQVSLSNEQARRENSIRNQFKGREEELVRSLAKIASLEKKIITQDEEIRRLNSRL
ncbi:MAG: hypothetical protein CSA60_04025 [Neptuniibacter caesariensis]|uniref:KfrA N-terminal DNA-binding domain-containing protein n=1 Tax=Neptuniibacter caesariensis TaxID=207954 RepID=A0A2G6JK71_NEPCE|nr:MAG: hypothetical protein CSA60_04025 [Neptuniibacter caesariensis]